MSNALHLSVKCYSISPADVLGLLHNCKSIFMLKRIHALLITFGLSQDHLFASKVLSFAATSPSRDINYAHQFFLRLPRPTIDQYNLIIRGYSTSRYPNRAVTLFVDMLRSGIIPDHLTFPFLVKASARLMELQFGCCVHGLIVRNGFVMDRYVSNSLIHMYGACDDIMTARELFDDMPVKNSVSWNTMLDGYAKCGDMGLMREFFDLMPTRDVVSWSALIDGYVKGGEYAMALMVFDGMKVMGPKANEVTMVSVLSACAHLGTLDQGRMMHNYIVENKLPLALTLRTSLVDMYAKCGAIEEALIVFNEIPVRQTDVLIWNAVIGCLSAHGHNAESLDMYRRMQSFGIRPDEITFLCLLSACAHGGLVKDAWFLFHSLSEHGMTPKTEHYACMVDVLARAGQLREAYKFVNEIPIKPTPSMLGALLNGCLNHRDLDLAEVVGKKLVALEPDHDGRYVGLSNVYASGKRWDEARTTREMMEIRGVKKFPGFSVVQILGIYHRFIAHDKIHPTSDEIYKMLHFVLMQMKPNTDSETNEHSAVLVETI